MESSKNNSLLLTGASGFVGSAILAGLRSSYDITTAGRSASSDIIADLICPLPDLPRRFGTVVHAAGLAHAAQGLFDAVNVTGTANLCHALEAAGVPDTFIYISSVAVYGLTEGTDVTESYPLNATTPYGLSKIKAERFLTLWARAHGVRLVILRPALVYSPDAPGNIAAMRRAMAGHYYFSIRPNHARKSIVSPTDLAGAVAVAIAAKEASGPYNICDSSNPRFTDLEEAVAGACGCKRPRKLPLCIARVLARIGDILPFRTPIDTHRLRKITSTLTFSNSRATALGWHPGRD